jgi:hypothetical protein
MYFSVTPHNPRHHFAYLYIISDINLLKYIYRTVKLKFYLVFQDTNLHRWQNLTVLKLDPWPSKVSH